MKFGVRKPNLKSSLKARTTGRAKRAVKKAVVPGYGKKGMGWVNNPKKAAYNKVYNKTTFGVSDFVNSSSSRNSSKLKSNTDEKNNKPNAKTHISEKKRKKDRVPIGEHATTLSERIIMTITHIILFILAFFIIAWLFSQMRLLAWIFIAICFVFLIYLLIDDWKTNVTTEYKTVYEDELTENDYELIRKYKK